MKIAVSANGPALESAASPVFGRCPYYLFVESETMAFEACPNPAMDVPGGAGIKAAQYISSQGAEVLITGNVGPNALQVLEPAGIKVYHFEGGCVRDALEAWQSGKISGFVEANAAEYSGMDNPFVLAAVQQDELAELQAMAKDLRSKIAAVTEKINEFERKCVACE